MQHESMSVHCRISHQIHRECVTKHLPKRPIKTGLICEREASARELLKNSLRMSRDCFVLCLYSPAILNNVFFFSQHRCFLMSHSFGHQSRLPTSKAFSFPFQASRLTAAVGFPLERVKHRGTSRRVQATNRMLRSRTC